MLLLIVIFYFVFQLSIVPYIAVSVVDMIGFESTARIIHYVCLFVDPPYIVFGGLYFISKVSYPVYYGKCS